MGGLGSGRRDGQHHDTGPGWNAREKQQIQDKDLLAGLEYRLGMTGYAAPFAVKSF